MPAPSRGRWVLAVAALALAGAGGAPASTPASRPDERAVGRVTREMRLVMGTTAEVAVAGLADPTPALDAAFDALALVDERMSLWKESELASLNRAGHGVVSPETFDVIRHALEIAAASGGAFDPTVEPLVRARGGFGDEARPWDAARWRALVARVDHRRVGLDPATRTVRLEGGVRLVLDALAKGDAADRALAALRAAGATGGLVDLGGSTLAVFGEPRPVDLRDPLGEGRGWASFRLRDAALGTSGGDQQPGHILDPRTGEPAHGVLQATVVARGAREADALSTAVFVLGADAGLALLEERGAHGIVLLLDASRRRRVVRTTPGFGAAHDLVVADDVELREQ